VLCIFCDERGPRAKEDIIPNWLAEELGGVPPILTTHFANVTGEESRKFTQTHQTLATLKFPEVCVNCNGGWMSRMESLTKAHLIPMIHGERTVLSPSVQRQIAAWVQLKGISLDAYYAIQYRVVRHLPAFVAHTFGQQFQPLPTATVDLGWFEAFEEGAMVPFASVLSR